MAVDKSIYYDFYDFRLDVERQQLLKNGQPVQLTHKAFQILHLLVQNSGQTTKKEDIFSELWSDSFVEDGNLTQHIYVLRKALGQTPNGQSYIETVPRQGYRFTLQPEQISIENPLVETLEPASADDDLILQSEIGDNSESSVLESVNYAENNLKIDGLDDLSAPEPAELAGQRFSFRLFLIGVLVLLFAFTVATGIYYFQQKTQEASSAVADVNSIAVLPFKPIGERIDKEKFGLGMADAIITRLSNLQRIVVRPTSAVFPYTDQSSLDVIAAGRELGVDAVLEGTIQSDGQRVRLSVQLIRVSDGKPLWAENFQESVSDIFALQDSISAQVATALSINLTQQQEQLLAQRSTSSPEAFQAYQLGIYFWNKRSKTDLQKAIEHFTQAIEYDPNYAYAYAGLADTYSMLGQFGFADRAEMREKTRLAAEKALAINDSLGEPYVALALAEANNNNFTEARRLLDRALALSPYNATARQRYGYLLIIGGNLDEGTRQIRLSQEYDPLSPSNNKSLCNALMYQRDFLRAVKYCEKGVELSPNTPGNRSSLAHAYFHAGKHEEAIMQLELEAKSGNNFSSTHTSLAYFYAEMGRKPEAEKIYEELKKDVKNDKWLPLTLAPTGFSLGKKDEAFSLFKKAVEMIDSTPEVATIIKYSPTFDKMKADSEFAAIMPR